MSCETDADGELDCVRVLENLAQQSQATQRTPWWLMPPGRQKDIIRPRDDDNDDDHDDENNDDIGQCMVSMPTWTKWIWFTAGCCMMVADK